MRKATELALRVLYIEACSPETVTDCFDMEAGLVPIQPPEDPEFNRFQESIICRSML